MNSYPVASMLKRVMQLFRDGLDEKLRPHGITAAQLHILAALEKEPGISGARLARACLVTPQTTQVLIRGVESNGWIQRTRHPENERILLGRLTPAGRRMLAQSRAAIGETYTKMLHGFATAEVETLESLLGKCAANFEG